MIQNRLEQFSTNQAVTTTADSTNVIYIGNHGDDLQRDLTFYVNVREAVTADGSATVAFSLYTGDTEGSQATQLYTSGAIAKASLTKGSFPVKIPMPPNLGKYLKVVYTVATGPLTAGKFDAGLIWGIDQTA